MSRVPTIPSWIVSIALLCLAWPASAMSIFWEYQATSSGYHGRGVKFFLHDKLPGYSYGNNGTPLAGQTVDMTNGSGIGAALAKRIVDYRQQQPGQKLRSVSDLTAVKGISPKKLAALQPLLTTAPPKKAPAPISINVNTATQAQLEAIPGIGRSKAAAIVNYRTTKGLTFTNQHQLTWVSGISRQLANKIAPHIKFDGQSQLGGNRNAAFGQRRYRTLRVPRRSFASRRRQSTRALRP